MVKNLGDAARGRSRIRRKGEKRAVFESNSRICGMERVRKGEEDSSVSTLQSTTRTMTTGQ